MDIAIWLSPIVALIGVGLGGLLSNRSQDRAWERQRAHQWHETRRRSYGAFVSAMRQYRAYLASPQAEVTVSLAPDGFRLVPAFDEAGLARRQAIDMAYADVQFLAGTDRTIEAATAFYRLAFRLATARGVLGPILSKDITEPFWAAEREFINVARDELELGPVATMLFVKSPVLQDMDRTLRSAFEQQATGKAAQEPSGEV